MKNRIFFKNNFKRRKGLTIVTTYLKRLDLRLKLRKMKHTLRRWDKEIDKRVIEILENF